MRRGEPGGLTLRLLSGDGESLDSVDTSSAEYQQQYQTVYDALSRLDSAYVTLATKVNNAVKLSIEKYVTSFNKTHKKATDTSRKGRISVSSEKSFQRNYPYGAFAAAVLGFTDADGVGTYGLEKSYQSTLAGVDGRTITQRNAVGNAIADANATTFAAKDGSNLVLSLDVNVQEIAERYLNEAIAANTVENRGCAIVMDVKTGAILAMASKPDFDPNDPLNFTANEAYLNELVHAEPELYGIYKKDADGNYITDELGNKILDEEADYSGYYRDILWKNKTITELYYPGSVFKVITSAMGIDSGVANMNTTFTCSGAYGVAKETYHCAGRKAHGLLNMAEALRKSCNIYYIQLGQRVGSQQFYNYFDAFGFTARTGVDLPSETNFMQYYRADQLGEVQLASSSFGQAMAITPLQMCTAIAATVNGGYLVTPHVVDKITDANGNVIQEIGANVRRQVISGRPQQRPDGLFLHPCSPCGGQYHQRGGPLSWHRHRRRGPQRYHRYRAEPCGYRVEQRAGEPEHSGLEASAAGESEQPVRCPGHLPVPPTRGARFPTAPPSTCIPIPTRAATPRCRM